MAKIIKLIYTEEKVGLGIEGDPVRKCPQLWTLDGKLVSHHDPEKKYTDFHQENLRQ